MKKYTFFYHYNKPASRAAGRPRLTVHYRGKCMICDSLECLTRSESKIRKSQPHVVIAGKSNRVEFSEGKQHIVIH